VPTSSPGSPTGTPTPGPTPYSCEEETFFDGPDGEDFEGQDDDISNFENGKTVSSNDPDNTNQCLGQIGIDAMTTSLEIPPHTSAEYPGQEFSARKLELEFDLFQIDDWTSNSNCYTVYVVVGDRLVDIGPFSSSAVLGDTIGTDDETGISWVRKVVQGEPFTDLGYGSNAADKKFSVKISIPLIPLILHLCEAHPQLGYQ